MKYLLIIIGFSVLTFFLKGQQPPQQDKKINIVLPVSDVNTVIDALSKLPYEKSAPIIQEIVRQANAQLNPPIPPVPVDTSKQKKKP